MDIVYISELKVDTFIGIYEWEKTVKQTVSLDLEMSTDIKRVAQSDQVEDAVDYFAVSKRLTEFVGEGRFNLLETMAEEIASIIRNEFKVRWLKLRVSKPGAIQAARDVGVVIERGQRG